MASEYARLHPGGQVWRSCKIGEPIGEPQAVLRALWGQET